MTTIKQAAKRLRSRIQLTKQGHVPGHKRKNTTLISHLSCPNIYLLSWNFELLMDEDVNIV